MFKRKTQIEVVPETAYTDFSDRYEKEKKSPSNGVLITAATAATASLATYAVTQYTNPTINHTPDPTSIPPTLSTAHEPLNVLAQNPSIPVDMMTADVIPTGFIADQSLEMLANVLDPVIQILVAISFPIASVIMVGSCFFFMFGNTEKGWDSIMRAGLGYILIQLSPLFLEILRQIGKAV